MEIAPFFEHFIRSGHFSFLNVIVGTFMKVRIEAEAMANNPTIRSQLLLLKRDRHIGCPDLLLKLNILLALQYCLG